MKIGGVRRGFSMIELVIVLIIMGIVALMSVPKFDLSHIRANAALRQLSMFFMQAQRTALAKQYNVIVSVDVSSNRVRMVEDRNNSNTFDAGDRMVWTALEPGVRFVPNAVPLDGITGTVTFVRNRTVDGFPSVIFRRNGAASSDGALFFTSKPTDPGSMRAIAITQSTGRADAFKFNGTGWVPGGA